MSTTNLFSANLRIYWRQYSAKTKMCLGKIGVQIQSSFEFNFSLLWGNKNNTVNHITYIIVAMAINNNPNWGQVNFNGSIE